MPHPFPHIVPPPGRDHRHWLPHQVHSLRTTIEEAYLLLQVAQQALSLLSDPSKTDTSCPEGMSDEPDDLVTLSISQAQQMLGVSRSTVYVLLNSGALAWARVGKRRRILRSELFTYLHNNPKAS